MPQPGDEDAPRPVAPDATYFHDAELVKTVDYFAEAYHWTVKEILDTEESWIDDLTKHRQQMGYRRWAQRVDVNPDEDDSPQDEFFANAPLWTDAFRVAEAG